MVGSQKDGAVLPMLAGRIDSGLLVRVLWGITALYLVVLAFVTLWPVHVDDNAAGGFLHNLINRGHGEGWLPAWFTYELVEWLSNVVMFVPGGFLLGLLLTPPWRWFVPLMGLATTVAIESVQHFMPGRTSSALDVLANSWGALLGWFLALVVLRCGWVSSAGRVAAKNNENPQETSS